MALALKRPISFKSVVASGLPKKSFRGLLLITGLPSLIKPTIVLVVVSVTNKRIDLPGIDDMFV